MDGFIGRTQERQEFADLFQRKSASLVTCQGRRRIGKSRFINECARSAATFLAFSGLPPREGLASQDQLDAFSDQLAKQTQLPHVPLDAWPTAFQLLASQLPAKGKVVVLLDEMKQKVARLKLPKGQSFRTVLIHSGEIEPAVEASDYFDFIIPADELVAG